jgi:hypothetical protein
MCSGGLSAVILAVLAAAPAPAASATITPADAAALLSRSDVAGRAPESFRALFRITALHERPDPMDVEVWRSGESRSLVRFLGPKEKGKYLLRIDGVAWFLAPGARRPVKMSRAHRLRGSASLDDILGTRYGRDYAIEGATETEEAGGVLVVLDLVAKDRRAPYAKVRYHVRRATERPVRVEHLLPSGKTSSVVEFLEWEEGSRPVVRRLVVTDRLRPGRRTEITLLVMEVRKVPDGLFELQDPTEREKLEGQSSEAGSQPARVTRGPFGRPGAPRRRALHRSFPAPAAGASRKTVPWA